MRQEAKEKQIVKNDWRIQFLNLSKEYLKDNPNNSVYLPMIRDKVMECTFEVNQSWLMYLHWGFHYLKEEKLDHDENLIFLINCFPSRVDQIAKCMIYLDQKGENADQLKQLVAALPKTLDCEKQHFFEDFFIYFHKNKYLLPLIPTIAQHARELFNYGLLLHILQNGTDSSATMWRHHFPPPFEVEEVALIIQNYSEKFSRNWIGLNILRKLYHSLLQEHNPSKLGLHHLLQEVFSRPEYLDVVSDVFLTLANWEDASPFPHDLTAESLLHMVRMVRDHAHNQNFVAAMKRLGSAKVHTFLFFPWMQENARELYTIENISRLINAENPLELVEKINSGQSDSWYSSCTIS